MTDKEFVTDDHIIETCDHIIILYISSDNDIHNDCNDDSNDCNDHFDDDP